MKRVSSPQIAKQQVPPLRYAPVGMTILSQMTGIAPSRRFQKELSSRPERTRISYRAKPTTSTYAALIKESRMNFAEAIDLDRKSGGAQWRDLLFARPHANASRSTPRLCRSFCKVEPIAPALMAEQPTI
jgi:hypothetical protein